MASATDRLAVAALALLLGACTAALPSASPAGTASPTRAASPSVVGPSPSVAASPSSVSPAPTGPALPVPGTPWDGSTLLREMAASTRPEGVPDEVETPAIAAAIAETVWTVDGATWDTIAIGGHCGPSTCTIDLAGSRLGRAGEDLWTLEIDPGTGEVRAMVADVRSLPHDLVDDLDLLARTLDDDLSKSMTLATARWLPPPAEPGRFALSYRSGGEEGSCTREVILDASAGDLVEASATGC